MKKNQFIISLLFAMLVSSSSCNQSITNTTSLSTGNLSGSSSSNQSITNTTSSSNQLITENSEYIYEIINDDVKLIKYKGEFKTLIDIPETIDGKKVVSIAKGCFVKENKNIKQKQKDNSTEDTDNEISDNSTYSIDSNIETIEDGAFDDNSTFITENTSKPNGWEESSMQGSGKEGTGNVYYDTLDEDTIVSKGIVFLKNRERGGIIVARCLTQRKEVEIPSLVDGEKVVDIGKGAFSHNDKIEKVTLPSTIGEVFGNAFSYCSSLKEIVFDSANLSRLMAYSFDGCTSLDIVKLPENCTYLAPQAFANCGNIEKIYIPFSMVHIASNAFYNTTIGEVIYSGTQEQFQKIKLGSGIEEFFNNTIITYAKEQTRVTLNRLNEINNYEDNTFVEFEGVITGFYDQKGVYVTDPVDGFSIWCYSSSDLPFYDEEYIGRKVKVSGDKIHYIGQLEVTHIEIELVGEDKIDVEPIELDLSDENLNIDNYLGYYVVVRGKVSEVFKKYIYLEGSDIYLFAFHIWPNSISIMPGDVIEVLGWVHAYNQIREIMYDSRLIKVIE